MKHLFRITLVAALFFAAFNLTAYSQSSNTIIF